MSREEILYLLPYLFSLALSLGIFIYAWLRREVRGARLYTWFVAGQLLSIFGFIIELITPSLEIKVMWDKSQWFAQTLYILAYLIFAVQITEHRLQYPKITWAVLLAIPLIFNFLVLTDGAHHLIYSNPHLSTAEPFTELEYDLTTTVHLYAIYFYFTTLYGIALLLKRAFQPYNTYRWQFVILAVGFFIPVAFTIFSFFGIKITPQRDSTPFTFVLENLIIAWGLFRYSLFDIVPIARERIVENLRDPVIVLDSKNRVADANQAALKMLGKEFSQVLGRSSREVFARWPIIVGELEFLDTERREIAVEEGEDTFYYDVNISSIYSDQHQLLGRIVAARDITRYKTLESGYRLLSEELEQRVRERTEELRNSAERYRAVVENQTEFIVRWKPDGTRTFVNEAYCRYFGITPEEAISSSFMPLIVEEDRRAVAEKMERLMSSAVSSETEIHRVIKPDGRIGWQEWTDKAIRNETGQIVEFQSVGRDVTDRKQAEEALRESEAIYRKAIEVAGGVPYRQSYPEEEFHIIYDFIGEGISQITGYNPEEFSEALWDSLVQESQLVGELTKYSWREAIQRVRSGASSIWQCEHRIRTRAGETRWIYETAVELRDKDGKSHGSIGLFQDITARKQAEEALRKSEERFSKAFQSSPVIITLSLIETGKLLEVNEAFERVMGFSRDEVIGKTAAELGLWANPTDRERVMQIFLADGKLKKEELQFRTKSGNIMTCHYSAELIEISGAQCVLAIVEDITERKKAEDRILRLNRLYVTISQINQAIVHARNKDDLFSEICRVAIEYGQFRLAWIGLIDIASELVKPIVFAGEELGYLENLVIDYHDTSLGSDPTGTAIREERCIICQDIATDPRMRPWRGQTLSRGYRSSAAVPLREHGRVIGALTVYAGEVQGFDAEDEELLEQIGLDVSFAIDSINHESERKRAEENLAEAYDTTLEGWAKALELRDKETEGHSRRVTETTLAVARAMGLSEEELLHMRRGSILHDIGKMGIPDDILRKNGPLTAEEKMIVQKHPTTAFELLKPIAYLNNSLEIPYCHHEKWDGTGYPCGLKGEEIPLAARIFAVVDVWDALSSDRPYRNAWPREKVAQYLIAESGKHFDPQVLSVFLTMLEKGEI